MRIRTTKSARVYRLLGLLQPIFFSDSVYRSIYRGPRIYCVLAPDRHCSSFYIINSPTNGGYTYRLGADVVTEATETLSSAMCGAGTIIEELPEGIAKLNINAILRKQNQWRLVNRVVGAYW